MQSVARRIYEHRTRTPNYKINKQNQTKKQKEKNNKQKTTSLVTYTSKA